MVVDFSRGAIVQAPAATRDSETLLFPTFGKVDEYLGRWSPCATTRSKVSGRGASGLA